MAFVNRLKKELARFSRGEEGTLSVEAVIIWPLLIYGMLATYTFFDVYRAKSLALKANYAVSDLLTRETNMINGDYINGIEKVYEFLTQPRNKSESWVRVTQVHCIKECATNGRKFVVTFSAATEGQPTYTNATVMDALNPILPLLAQGERAVVVETQTQYYPPVKEIFTGIGPRPFRDTVVTEPRFAPQLCWEDGGYC